jgi:hypothetical protein
VTKEVFAQRFPEFAAAGDPLIVATLDAAFAELCAEAWGALYDEAHGLLAASKLANSPLGHGLRMKAPSQDRPTDIYRQQFNALAAVAIEGVHGI